MKLPQIPETNESNPESKLEKRLRVLNQLGRGVYETPRGRIAINPQEDGSHIVVIMDLKPNSTFMESFLRSQRRHQILINAEGKVIQEECTTKTNQPLLFPEETEETTTSIGTILDQDLGLALQNKEGGIQLGHWKASE